MCVGASRVGKVLTQYCEEHLFTEYAGSATECAACTLNCQVIMLPSDEFAGVPRITTVKTLPSNNICFNNLFTEPNKLIRRNIIVIFSVEIFHEVDCAFWLGLMTKRNWGFYICLYSLLSIL